jgi:hypothetical protein
MAARSLPNPVLDLKPVAEGSRVLVSESGFSTSPSSAFKLWLLLSASSVNQLQLFSPKCMPLYIGCGSLPANFSLSTFLRLRSPPLISH